ncbi:MAG: F-type H+-transporting ATPase subunit gamma [Cyanobacteriota bacterium erpe_2018_sw_21hr_WHONDRS-SW48-000092_B_bin.40]|nr:F-type H+-transporting ATPase subunit gamma [Cyanobacteriota bacterium erpe_2018_sw_21hr_WHONDRS-SW48-000092_B_bin.40]
MSDTTENLRRKIKSASDLQSVVRTMKALTASSIGQYERSVEALADYYRTIELGLHACLPRDAAPLAASSVSTARYNSTPVNAIVFGSDQGLVGQFNDVVAEFAVSQLSQFLELKRSVKILAVGERVKDRLLDLGLSDVGLYSVPNSVAAISPLVGQILVDNQVGQGDALVSNFQLFYNRPLAAAVYEPVTKQMLPLDEAWRQNLISLTWPTKTVPEAIGGKANALRPLISSYLFVSLFRACAESLASENASRLAAMQRAEKNIDDLLEDLNGSFHRLRHSNIDEELFEVVSGFEALGARGE